MKKNILLSIALSISCLIANAQAPEKINYQAVARDLSGTPLVNQSLVVIFQIRQGSPTGTSVYTETHASISTNQFGLFTAEIGGGIPSTGTFAGINWGGGLHYLSVIVDGIPMGTSQLLSVPYALYAKQSANGPQGLPGSNSISIVTSEPAGANCQNGGNKIDVGTDDNNDNMLQTLEIDFTYYVCNGDSGSAAGDDWGNQVIISQGNNISGDGTTANPLSVFDNDTSATNEIQDLSISGNTIGITGGTGINLSPTAPGTGQVLTWNGTAWIAQNAGSGADNWGTQVVISDTTLIGDGTAGNPLGVNGVLTDNQDLSLTGNTLSLTNDPTPINLTPFLDNTDAQTLSLNTNVLSISNGNNVTLPTAPTYTAGTGINLTGNVITNTAPDQTVALNNGTGINVTGIYPNFTINNTSPATSTSITGGGLTTVTGTSPAFTVSTPAQTLTYTAPTLTLSNGGGAVTLPTSPWTKTGNFIYNNILTDSVGIGTNTPYSKLHIQGNYSSIGTIGTYIDLQNTFGSSTSPAKVGIRFKASNFPNGQHTKGGIIYSRNLSNARGDMLFLNNSNDDISEIDVANDVKMIIKNNGNIGIGTTTPTAKLHIVSSDTIGMMVSCNTSIAMAAVNSISGNPDPGYAYLHNGTIVGGHHINSVGDWKLELGATNPVIVTGAGNVGIGTTTPTAKLHLEGSLRLNNLSATAPVAGSVLTSVDAQGNAEWQAPVIVTNYWSLNGLDIHNNNSGNVGIGTSIPYAPLHVVNPTQDLTNIMIASRRPIDGGDAVLSFSEDIAGTQGMGIKYDGVWNRLDIGDGVLSSTPIMTITRSGNVGVGTTAPAHPLHVAGNTFLDGVTQVGGTAALAAQFKIINAANYNLSMLVTGGTGTQLTIQNSSGNVTIGNSTSVTRLFIQDNNTSTTESGNSYLSMQNLANTTNTSTGIRFRVGGTTAINGNFHYKGGIFFNHDGGTNGEGSMVFAVNNIASSANATAADAAMTISRYGDVGIGTTPSTLRKLYVSTSNNQYAGYYYNNRTSGSNYGLYSNCTSTSGTYNVSVYGRASGAATTNYGLYGYATGGGTDWALYSLGPAYSSTGTWSGSDERLKTNIKNFNGAIEKLTQIDIKTYNFKTEEYKHLNFPSTKQYGVIAQNLEKVFPEMVLESEHNIPDENGNFSDKTVSIKAVNYTQLIPVLIKAVQEQQQMIEELQKEIQELKNN